MSDFRFLLVDLLVLAAPFVLRPALQYIFYFNQSITPPLPTVGLCVRVALVYEFLRLSILTTNAIHRLVARGSQVTQVA